MTADDLMKYLPYAPKDEQYFLITRDKYRVMKKICVEYLHFRDSIERALKRTMRTERSEDK